jgi:hypothetical protein
MPVFTIYLSGYDALPFVINLRIPTGMCRHQLKVVTHVPFPSTFILFGEQDAGSLTIVGFWWYIYQTECYVQCIILWQPLLRMLDLGVWDEAWCRDSPGTS